MPKLYVDQFDDTAQMSFNLGLGNSHAPFGYAFGTGSQAINPNVMYAVPDTRDIIAATMGILVTTAGAGNCRLGYYDTDRYGRPRNLIEELTSTSQLDVSGTGDKTRSLAAPTARIRNRRWLVILSNIAFTARGMSGSNAVLHNVLGSPDKSSTTPNSHITVAQTYGPLPTVFPTGYALVASTTAPLIFYGE